MWGAIAAIGAQAVGGIMQARAAKDAAQIQAQATDNATASQRAMFDKQVELQSPFRETGLTANNRLAQLMGLSGDAMAPEYGSLSRSFTAEDFQRDPGYEFRMKEGMKGIEGGAAARGGLLSGAALKAIQRFGQDYATNEYGNSYARFNADQTNKYNRLAGLVNTGQGATNQLSNAAGNFGAQMGSNIIGAGNAQAAGVVGQANAWNNAISQGLNQYQSSQLIDRISQPRTSYSYSYPSAAQGADSFVPGYGYGTSYGE